MDCSEFRAQYSSFAMLPLPREVWDTPDWTAWTNHRNHCVECADWDFTQRIIARGHDPASFPCVCIGDQLTHTCNQHSDLRDCPDVLIVYLSRFDEYEIPGRDGGMSFIIRFCPWCGVKLPESKRDRWFEELHALGYNDPVLQAIPDKYLTDEWHRATN